MFRPLTAGLLAAGERAALCTRRPAGRAGANAPLQLAAAAPQARERDV